MEISYLSIAYLISTDYLFTSDGLNGSELLSIAYYALLSQYDPAKFFIDSSHVYVQSRF